MANGETIEGEFDETAVAEMAAMTTGQAIALARVEIDMQISTARAYPRIPSQVQKKILEMVTLDKASAEECTYALPVDGKPVTGPSIRFAEAVKQAWGNGSAGARVTEVNRAEKYVEAEGVFLDLETNMRTTFRTRRSIAGKRGNIYSERMIVTTGNAASSIAMREAILKGVPKPVWRQAYEAVLQTIKGDIKTLTERRAKAIAAFANYGVSADQIFTRLEVKGAEDITIDDLPELLAMYQSIKSGEATVEDYFGKDKPQGLKNALNDEGDVRPKSATTAPAKEPGARGEERASVDGGAQSAAVVRDGEVRSPQASPSDQSKESAASASYSAAAGAGAEDHPPSDSAPKPARGSNEKGQDGQEASKDSPAVDKGATKAPAGANASVEFDEDSYREHVKAMCAGSQSAASLKEQYAAERIIRNKPWFTSAFSDECRGMINARKAELEAKA